MTDPDACSRVRNAARDVANSYLRFERDLERLRNAADGLPEDVVVRACQDGCDSPERARAFTAISEQLRGTAAAP